MINNGIVAGAIRARIVRAPQDVCRTSFFGRARLRPSRRRHSARTEARPPELSQRNSRDVWQRRAWVRSSGCRDPGCDRSSRFPEPQWVRSASLTRRPPEPQLLTGNGQLTTDNGLLVGSFVTFSHEAVGSFVAFSREAVGSFVTLTPVVA